MCASVSRPLGFSSDQKRLFVNVDAGAAGARLRVGVLDGASGASLRSLTQATGIVSNATRLMVSWGAAGSLLPPSRKSVVRFQFELRGDCKLYSFWTSATNDGRSGGYVGRGGPGFSSLRDV